MAEPLWFQQIRSTAHAASASLTARPVATRRCSLTPSPLQDSEA